MSTRPKLSSAEPMMARPPVTVATVSVDTTAVPPAALISAATAAAGPLSAVPGEAAADVVDDDLGARAASNSAYSRPRPRRHR